MFQLSNTSFEKTKALNALVSDYIHKKDEITHLYSHFPDKNGFSQIINSNLYGSFNREILVSTLLKQSGSVKNTHSKTLDNINLLKNKNVYTITTGHQLCLFTGPLYFIYKLFSAINMAEKLAKEFPEVRFVPVYWMAGEDHDFEEINHFNVFGKNIKWESAQTGAVGEFKTAELQTVFLQLKEILGESVNATYLLDLFEKSYLQHTTLKDATRYLVNELFGKYGLVTIDGNDVDFKRGAKDLFSNDIFENNAYKKVNETIEELKKQKYHSQVNPREINCFYMADGVRGRIEKEGNGYKVNGTEIKLSKEELEKIIGGETEKISPNVVLRPLYQQSILPNIAYVGGPGEIAYWLQYKSMFELYNTQFPVLSPRGFVTVFEKGNSAKISKLGFSSEDMFKEEEELIKEFQVKSNNVFEAEAESEKLIQLYNQIREKINSVDKTLVGAVTAEEQKTLKGLEVIVQKANKALKQKSETEINQVKMLKQKFFPNNIPQERFDNFSAYYSKWGEDFFEFLKNNIDPFVLKHNFITEI